MDLRSHWRLSPDIVFLNHGSFGACPAVVLEEQRRLRARMEREPVSFFVRDLEELLDGARADLARLAGCAPEDLAFVPNATTAVNAVLRSRPLEPGDELVTTDHAYNACRNVLAFAAGGTGARVVVANVPFPLRHADDVVEAVLASVGPRTRLALIDHVTSPTGLVFPLERLVRELQARGVEVLVDGAHAIGMLPLDLESLRADYYTANCHKWLCAPKGSAFLYVRRDRQAAVRPAVISHGANALRRDRSRFLLEFDWVGTTDPTPYLAIPAAIRFLEALLPGGLAALRDRNRRLALEARDLLCAALGVPPPCPDEMIGSLAAVPLPDGSPEPPRSSLYADALQEALFARGIEVPVVPWPAPPRRLLRISAQAYNTRADYERLVHVLGELLRA
jgi:isopenicillin-N epimerase